MFEFQMFLNYQRDCFRKIALNKFESQNPASLQNYIIIENFYVLHSSRPLFQDPTSLRLNKKFAPMLDRNHV